MVSRQPSTNFVRGVEAFTGPTQCLNEIVQAWTDYLKIAEEERTKRRDIEAWEKVTLAAIKAKRDILINYLEYSFDERAKNFQSLFQAVDQAMASGDNQQLSLTLHTITELAKSSPFKDLADLSTIKAALNDPNHVWEL
jgi:uncharacterized protein YecA (UPF0149 family)